MKKIKLLLFSLLVSFSMIGFISAESISKITMDIYVDSEGNATIEEVWQGKFDKNTEIYHPYFNLGNSSIVMNSVTDDLGNVYTLNPKWNIKASKEAKAKTFGIYKDGSEVDVCWGITEYGNRTYKVNYTINNFIYNTTDGYQILFWQLIPYDLSSPVKYAYIKVHSDFLYEDTLDVWGYGNYGGTAYVYDGYIEMQSPDKGLSTSEYMTMLVKFPANTFNTNNTINKTFEKIFDGAEEGTKKYDQDKEDLLATILGLITTFLPFIIIIFGSLAMAKYGNRKNKVKNKIIPKKKDILPFRDLACKDDYAFAYFIASEYGLYKQQTDYLGAVILKWIKNDNVRITTEEKGVFKNKNTKIELVKEPVDTNELRLFNMMKTAAKDEILESNEFKNYCSRNYSKVLNWFDDVLDDNFNKYKKEKVYVEEIDKKGIFGTFKEYNANTKLNEKATQLAGMKLFFKEFTLMHEKQAIEVKMWRDYLIYAQIFGMAKEVAKEFKNLYPDVIDDNTYNSMILVHDFSTTSVNAASVARTRAQSYSSGGGGFSSGGGGGGSFGGGGGGGGSR